MNSFKAAVTVFVSTLLTLIFTCLLAHGDELGRRQFRTEIPHTDNVVKIAFFDADSTLRVSLSGGVSANSPTDVMILPGVPERIAEFVNQGYLIAIVSNQGGVANPKIGLTIETADSALQYTAELIESANPIAKVHYIDFAEQSDEFRKPKTGMALLLEKTLNDSGYTVDWSKSFMVGDSAYKKGDVRPDGLEAQHFSNSDRLFAENLRKEGKQVTFYEPNKVFGWELPANIAFDKAEQVRKYLKDQAAKKACATVLAQ